MKLKLENQTDVTILGISEQIGAKDVAVLKAGLTKIFQSGRVSVLLDLTGVREADLSEAGVATEIQGMKAWAQNQGASVVIVGTASPIIAACQASTREEGLKKFGSSLDHLQALHTRLTQQLKTLESMREQVLQKSNAASSVAEQIRSLRQENGELRTQIAELEQLLGELIGNWSEPVRENPGGKAETAMKIMTSILRQEGILP